LAGKPHTVLVTGGAGYIGSHAAKALSQAGHRVVVYDNLVAGHREAVKYGEFVQGDILDPAMLETTMKAHGVDAVMHFAAFLDVGESVREPAKYYRNNVGGVLNVLDAMAANRIQTLVFSSTCATYGEPTETPITEAHPQRPINSYGETKLAAERAFPHYERAYGIHAIAFRYFNAAGADPDGELGEDHAPEIHVIPRALDAAAGGEGLKVFGDDYPTPDGTCLRDYIHVADLADAHVRGLESLATTKKSDVYNLGTGTPQSVRDIIGAVERVTGRKVPWTLAPRRAGDPAVLYASPDKARAAFGWTPKHASIDDIVRTAWTWRQAHPRGYGG
jgi:UDP-glucose-4-epimerase GalE